MNYRLIHVETQEEARIEIKDGELVCYSNLPTEILGDFEVLKRLSEEGCDSVKCHSS